MYAICFDLDSNLLEKHHPTRDSKNGYDQIGRVFADHGFRRQQGSVYFGGADTTPVDCFLAVQEVTKRYSWFRFVVRDIRMLWVEENNDLMPIVERQADLPLARTA